MRVQASVLCRYINYTAIFVNNKELTITLSKDKLLYQFYMYPVHWKNTVDTWRRLFSHRVRCHWYHVQSDWPGDVCLVIVSDAIGIMSRVTDCCWPWDAYRSVSCQCPWFHASHLFYLQNLCYNKWIVYLYCQLLLVYRVLVRALVDKFVISYIEIV